MQYWPTSVGEVLTVDSSRIGVELRVILKTSELQSHWQHRVFTVEEITHYQDQVSVTY